MNPDIIVVLTTVPNIEEAETLARKIVEAKLAACVQILPPMKSYYFWDNQIQADSEHLLLIKTLTGKFDELEKFIKTNHSTTCRKSSHFRRKEFRKVIWIG